jgi:hypothetical protein
MAEKRSEKTITHTSLTSQGMQKQEDTNAAHHPRRVGRQTGNDASIINIGWYSRLA